MIGKLLDDVAAAGFAVELTDSGPRLVPHELGARMPAELLAEVKHRRAAIVSFLLTGREPETEGERCAVCSATVYDPTPEIFRMCRMLLCPYWTEESGVGPEWLGEARRDRRRAG